MLLPICKVSPTLIKTQLLSCLIYYEFPLAYQDILLKQSDYKIYYNIHNFLVSEEITITIINQKEFPSLREGDISELIGVLGE
jgi:N-acetylglutamate synthase-like GNAT family acetyltransferase